MSYLIHDCETTIKKSYKRSANPFDKDNWVVANGFRRPGEEIFCEYYTKALHQRLPISKDDRILVGFNYKFDLLWHWHLPELQAFLKRGGRIWCCQYAEYLLEAQDPSVQMCSMDSIVEKYGGKLKIDEVKAMWKAGINTPDIPKDLLLRYLGGSNGDIANTEKIYLGQVKKARERGMLFDILQRMEGLLCTTEMEYNGLYVNREQAYLDKAMLEGELEAVDTKLIAALPEFPYGFQFKWTSPVHKSCLLFGGTAKYEVFTPHEPISYPAPKKIPHVAIDGLPLMPKEDWDNLRADTREDLGSCLDRFKSGKKVGEIKIKQAVQRFDCNLVKPKGKIQKYGFSFPGYTKPNPSWAGANTDFEDKPLYSTGKDIIDELGGRGIGFLTSMANRAKIAKDLGTYYLIEEGGKKKGMLTCLMPNNIIHHNLNHTLTITSRLTSSNPNLQNITRPDFDKALGRPKSVVKRMFTSRFGKDGRMIEEDYKQLEVVVQGMLTGDRQLLKDLKAGVDFHCKRLAAKEGMLYEEVIDLCKVQGLPEWKVKRTKTKEFTFQRAFGASLKSIAAKTGMDLKDVELLSEAEEKLYPGITKFYDSVEAEAKRTRIPTNVKEPFPDKPAVWTAVGKGFWQGPTKALFCFYETPCYAWMRKRGIMTSLYRPTIQNYPIQGTAAQIVQYILGELIRLFLEKNNYEGKAFLVNTVHDCVWVDTHKDVTAEVKADVKQVMESVPAVLKRLHGLELNGLEFPVDAEEGLNMMELE